jgi:hypothetical protein
MFRVFFLLSGGVPPPALPDHALPCPAILVEKSVSVSPIFTPEIPLFEAISHHSL